MLTLRLNRKDLKKRRACSQGLALFDLIKEMQDEIRTANGKQLRKSLKVEWSLLHQIWAATTWPEFMSWLITVGLTPCVNGAGANLQNANLYGANLYGANLQNANLRGANRLSDDSIPNGWQFAACGCCLEPAKQEQSNG